MGATYGVAQTLNNKVYIGGGWRLDGSSQQFYKYWYEMDYNAILGIDNKETINHKLTCYPNPTTNILYIQTPEISGEYTYVIYNQVGQRVATGTLPTDHKVTVNDLVPGQYVLEVVDTKESLRTKFSVINY